VVLVPATTAVQITVMINRRAPVTLHALVADLLGVRPEHFVAAGLDFQEGTAGAVGFGDEDAIADHHRITGVAAFDQPRGPGKLKIDFAGCWLQADQSTAGEHETPATVSDRRQHRTGITGQLVCDAVDDFARVLVEGDDAGSIPLQVGDRHLLTSRWTPTDL